METRVVLDSGNQVNYRRAGKSVLRALDHMGVWYEPIDLSWLRISSKELENSHLLILAQEGIGKSLSDEESNIILKMVNQGMGLVVLDGYLGWYPAPFLKEINLDKGDSVRAEALNVFPENRIIRNISRQEVGVKIPVLSYAVPETPEWNPLLLDGEGNVCGAYRKFGRGRIVFFFLSASVWQDEYLGFTAGLDGLFRGSLSWAAKKPFIMKSMPPFVTARIDDVSFSGSPAVLHGKTVQELRWLDILNKFGFMPNAGLFIDDIQSGDVRRMREKYYDGLAEFSPHAFSDPENINDKSIYMKHNGEEFSDDVLRGNFEKVDGKFSEFGITPSKTVNAHFAEVGLKALPFLKAGNQRYLMNLIRVGRAWSDPSAHSWDVEPYGKPASSMGVIPEDKDFFNVTSHPGKMDSGAPDFDFLYGCTPFWNESSSADVKKAVERGLFHIKRGLENGFFGCLMTHEQRIAHLAPEEWEKIIKGISSGLKEIPHTFKSCDYISSYAENRTFYRIEKAEFKQNLSIWLKGRNAMSQYLCLFLDEGENTVESFLEVPAFENAVVLNFKLNRD
ncbi:MAG: hypothetical protein JW957_06690 [Candidatus Omnitrophica bacterium]|nr:hypothetical protein [Candidatus Omnitrophota bacterium]